jgi:hypothetical protein
MPSDQGLGGLVGLVESPSRQIAEIGQAGFLDVSVLGEAVYPRDFNARRHIRAGDRSVSSEEKQFIELASSEFLM